MAEAEQMQVSPSNSDGSTNSRSRFWFWLLYIKAQILAFVIFVLTIVWISNEAMGGGGLSWSEAKKQFNYHPLCMIIGYVIIYGNAILSYRAVKGLRYKNVKLLHGGLLFAGFLFAIFGMIAVFEMHRKSGIPDLYSLHSWIGLLTNVFYVSQLTFSFIAFIYPTIPRAMNVFLPIHVFCGLIIFIMILASCVTGITEKAFFSMPNGGYSKLPSHAIVTNFLGVGILVFGALVIYLVTNRDFKR